MSELIKNQNKATVKLKKRMKKISKALSELVIAMNDECYDGIYYDDLGITRLFVDEAHNFKNVPIETKITKVLGINSVGSKKCEDMLHKVHLTQKQNLGGGVVMATGTPITNSITDAFIIQQYLQSGELAMLDLQNFDSWVGMFAEKVTEFEIDVDTSSYRLATRFAKFHNLPELTSLLSSIADFHQTDSSLGVPDFDGYTDALIGKTPEFEHYLQIISDRADDVRSGLVSRKDDNMLKITTDGRKAALDLRLVDSNAKFTYQSKVNRCAENVFDIYMLTKPQRSTQLIFCDTSVPKGAFNIYDELRRILTNFGIPDEEIAYIHDADTNAKREKMFSAVRNGEIRILIGSTFKLGLGINVQDKLIALHHLDIPWRPADMTQREGRILRQGNTNKKVDIYRYITEGSFDAYSWQLLETKQRFITGLLSGSLTERSGTDVDDTVLSYAEVKALAVGNPLVKKRVEIANELTRYLMLQRKFVENRMRLEKELLSLPAQIEHQDKLIKNASADKEFYYNLVKSAPVPKTTDEKKIYAQNRKNLRETIYGAVLENNLNPSEKTLTEYQGFKIILPANMVKENPFIWLQRQGKYHIELGDKDVGILIRIDNFLENLAGYVDKLKLVLQNLCERKNSIVKELEKEENYTDKIKRLKIELNNIDVKLGVEK